MPKKGQTWTPEQRAKILAAKQIKGGAAPEPTPEAPQAPRPRMPLQAIPQKPKGSRWIMRAGHWDEDALDQSAYEGTDELNIPKDMHPEGITLQWVTHTVYGQEMAQHRAGFEKSGWLPVHPEDFDGRFDGMFAQKGARGEINKDGLVLMAKPTAAVEKSRARDKARARAQVQIKEQALYGGDLPGVMGAEHPSARRFNHVNRSVEKIAIPED